MGESQGPGRILLLVSSGSRDEAERIGQSLVDAGLAEAATVIASARSYRKGGDGSDWAHEALLLATALESAAAQARRHIHENHSFDEPHVLAVPLHHDA